MGLLSPTDNLWSTYADKGAFVERKGMPSVPVPEESRASGLPYVLTDIMTYFTMLVGIYFPSVTGEALPGPPRNKPWGLCSPRASWGVGRCCPKRSQQTSVTRGDRPRQLGKELRAILARQSLIFWDDPQHLPGCCSLHVCTLPAGPPPAALCPREPQPHPAWHCHLSRWCVWLCGPCVVAGGLAGGAFRFVVTVGCPRGSL